MGSLLYAFMGALVAAQLAWALVFWRRYRTQKAHQDRLAAALAGARFWRVALARPEHLQRLWKLVPYQALGVLVDEGHQVRLRGRWHGEAADFDIVLPKDGAAQPSWETDLRLRAGSLAWVRFPTPRGALMVSAVSGLQPAGSREAMADLLRMVYPRLRLPAEAAQDFALEKNRASLAAIAAFFGLALLAALDTFMWSRFELIDEQLGRLLTDPAVLLGAAAWLVGVTAASWAALRAGEVPRRESYALALLLAFVVGLATLPALKRIDGATAAAPATEHRYRIADRTVRLVPVDTSQGLPLLRFARAPEYWAQFAVGSEVGIPLRRGGLGLWQLDHDRFDAPILRFYEEHPGR